ncbi:MAG: HAD-IIIA family hydrolase [Clostridia bacterium]|nr:HAD-IIIA family hydrolase [Clostridia bacterium]
MKAVIMAGGKGTRMATLGSDLPKPMLPLGGKPILAHEIACLVKEGITDIVLVVGHLGHVIKNYFGDGRTFGARITYFEESEPLGTAGALYHLKPALADDDFLLLGADLLFEVDLSRFLAYHRERGGLATLLTHPSTHLFDSVAVYADENGRVRALLPPAADRAITANRTNAGLQICAPALLDRLTGAGRLDLDREVLAPLATEGLLYAYNSPEYVKDVGTPERLASGEHDLAAGYPQKAYLGKKRPAVFLDRDGTINRHISFLSRPDQIELLPRAAEAIRLLNERHIPVIVATNQPVIARGDVTREGLAAIHGRLACLLAEQGAFVNDIFYCPHHPDGGFAGEVPALKTDCACRKPEPGLLLQAAARYNLDLPRSLMIGDRDTDVMAGKRAGCLTAKIGNSTKGLIPDCHADITGESLYECIVKFLESEGL